jgi:uncharacterized RDD family membrane protein YckC
MSGTLDSSLQGHYAGFISRLVAYVIDLVVISLALVIITWTVNTTIDLLNLDNVPAAVAINNIAIYSMTGLIAFLFVAGYFVLFWTLAGQTPGKILMGVRVDALDSQHLSRRVSLGRAVLRFGGYILSAIPFFAGILWILIDDRRQGWHDKIAGTCVIYTWEAPPGDLSVASGQGQQEAQGQQE